MPSIVHRPSSTVRFAISGLGHIGQRHLANIAATPGAVLAATCDPNVQDGETVRRRENGRDVPHFSDLKTMLAEADFDVLAVCSPNGLHAEQSLAALRAGRHVLIEKPMALRRVHAEIIVHEALAYDRRVFVVMQNRYSPVSGWLKKVVSEKLLGDLVLAETRCFWNRDDRYYLLPDGQKHAWRGNRDLDGGPIFTQFSHFVDALFWLFGDVSDVQAQFFNFTHQTSAPQIEDTGLVNFKFAGGGAGVFNYSTAVFDKNLESTLTILGTRGSVKIAGQYMERVELAHFQGIENCPPPAPETVNPAENHRRVTENVVAVLTGKAQIATNALEGMKVVDIIERIYGGR